MQDAIIYVRVSTADQTSSGLGLDVQIAACRAYCVLARLQPVEILTEGGVSASIPLKDRPLGRALLKAISRKQAQHVVSYKLDRLFRDAADALTQTRDWDKAGIAMHLVDVGGQTINTSTAMGRMFLTMMAGFAELERNLISERTASALQLKKSRGEVTGGAIPYGWRVAADGQHLEEDPGEQEARAAAKRLRGAGASYRDIAVSMTVEGFAARNGKPFAPIQIQRMVEYQERGA